MKKKDNNGLEYYMNLRYPVEIIPIPEEEGGGYMARIPQFGDAIIGDGDTPEEALADLEGIKKEIIRELIEAGESIPEPERDNYSGRFVLRVPRYLHRALVKEARRNGTSLNQFISNLLAQALTNYKAIFYAKETTFSDIYNIKPLHLQLLSRSDDYREAAA